MIPSLGIESRRLVAPAGFEPATVGLGNRHSYSAELRGHLISFGCSFDFFDLVEHALV